VSRTCRLKSGSYQKTSKLGDLPEFRLFSSARTSRVTSLNRTRERPHRRQNPSLGVHLALFTTLRRFRDVGGKPDKNDLAFLNEAETFMKEHTIASAMTDFDGEAVLQAKAGDYILFCDAESDVVWHTPVHLKPGNNPVFLDQNNLLKLK
jgi:hypothetical protein